jgi:hypothetical protein
MHLVLCLVISVCQCFFSGKGREKGGGVFKDTFKGAGASAWGMESNDVLREEEEVLRELDILREVEGEVDVLRGEEREEVEVLSGVEEEVDFRKLLNFEGDILVKMGM